MMKSIRILIVSDLHAHSDNPKAKGAPSFFSTDPVYQTPELYPFAKLVETVKENFSSIDWIVCPGDLGDKADYSAQKAAWTELLRIKTELGAEKLIATTGNHDLDTRRNDPELDPKSALQLLVPSFPVTVRDGDKNELKVFADRFWSRNYIIMNDNSLQASLVILNSSAFHGYSSDVKKPPNEHLRGKISPLTLSALRDDLDKIDSKINIIVLHHHIKTVMNVPDGGSVMHNGDKLIELLKQTKRQWLVIHGHQHYANVSYGDLSTFAPIVVSAGSVSVKPFFANKKHLRCQMHVVEIDCDATRADGSELFGTVTTWTWVEEGGWQRARSDAGLPYRGGFGYRANLHTEADQIALMLKARSERTLAWDEVINSTPKLRYLLPEQLEDLVSLLRRKSINVSFDEDACIKFLERN